MAPAYAFDAALPGGAHRRRSAHQSARPSSSFRGAQPSPSPSGAGPSSSSSARAQLRRGSEHSLLDDLAGCLGGGVVGGGFGRSGTAGGGSGRPPDDPPSAANTSLSSLFADDDAMWSELRAELGASQVKTGAGARGIIEKVVAEKRRRRREEEEEEEGDGGRPAATSSPPRAGLVPRLPGAVLLRRRESDASTLRSSRRSDKKGSGEGSEADSMWSVDRRGSLQPWKESYHEVIKGDARSICDAGLDELLEASEPPKSEEEPRGEGLLGMALLRWGGGERGERAGGSLRSSAHGSVKSDGSDRSARQGQGLGSNRDKGEGQDQDLRKSVKTAPSRMQLFGWFGLRSKNEEEGGPKPDDEGDDSDAAPRRDWLAPVSAWQHPPPEPEPTRARTRRPCPEKRSRRCIAGDLAEIEGAERPPPLDECEEDGHVDAHTHTHTHTNTTISAPAGRPSRTPPRSCLRPSRRRSADVDDPLSDLSPPSSALAPDLGHVDGPLDFGASGGAREGTRDSEGGTRRLLDLLLSLDGLPGGRRESSGGDAEGEVDGDGRQATDDAPVREDGGGSSPVGSTPQAPRRPPVSKPEGAREGEGEAPMKLGGVEESKPGLDESDKTSASTSASALAPVLSNESLDSLLSAASGGKPFSGAGGGLPKAFQYKPRRKHSKKGGNDDQRRDDSQLQGSLSSQEETTSLTDTLEAADNVDAPLQDQGAVEASTDAAPAIAKADAPLPPTAPPTMISRRLQDDPLLKSLVSTGSSKDQRHRHVPRIKDRVKAGPLLQSPLSTGGSKDQRQQNLQRIEDTPKVDPQRGGNVPSEGSEEEVLASMASMPSTGTMRDLRRRAVPLRQTRNQEWSLGGGTVELSRPQALSSAPDFDAAAREPVDADHQMVSMLSTGTMRDLNRRHILTARERRNQDWSLGKGAGNDASGGTGFAGRVVPASSVETRSAATGAGRGAIGGFDAGWNLPAVGSDGRTSNLKSLSSALKTDMDRCKARLQSGGACPGEEAAVGSEKDGPPTSAPSSEGGTWDSARKARIAPAGLENERTHVMSEMIGDRSEAKKMGEGDLFSRYLENKALSYGGSKEIPSKNFISSSKKSPVEPCSSGELLVDWGDSGCSEDGDDNEIIASRKGPQWERSIDPIQPQQQDDAIEWNHTPEDRYVTVKNNVALHRMSSMTASFSRLTEEDRTVTVNHQEAQGRRVSDLTSSIVSGPFVTVNHREEASRRVSDLTDSFNSGRAHSNQGRIITVNHQEAAARRVSDLTTGFGSDDESDGEPEEASPVAFRRKMRSLSIAEEPEMEEEEEEHGEPPQQPIDLGAFLFSDQGKNNELPQKDGEDDNFYFYSDQDNNEIEAGSHGAGLQHPKDEAVEEDFNASFTMGERLIRNMSKETLHEEMFDDDWDED